MKAIFQGVFNKATGYYLTRGTDLGTITAQSPDLIGIFHDESHEYETIFTDNGMGLYFSETITDPWDDMTDHEVWQNVCELTGLVMVVHPRFFPSKPGRDYPPNAEVFWVE